VSKYLERARGWLESCGIEEWQAAIWTEGDSLAALLESVEREVLEKLSSASILEYNKKVPETERVEGTRGVDETRGQREMAPGTCSHEGPAAPSQCCCKSLAAALQHVIARHPMLMRDDSGDPWYLNGADAALRAYNDDQSRRDGEGR
jgi:hypothetical protein